MIAYLAGQLLEKQPNRIVVNVNGVGYEVHVPLSTFYELGEVSAEIKLQIFTHVREDTLALFGFKTGLEKRVFENLTSVAGIGPKLAITILSGMSVPELVPAIRQGNVSRLVTIPGVGRKTAERLVLELRDKLAKLEELGGPATSSLAGLTPSQEDVISALSNLGYSKAMAEQAVSKVSVEVGPDGAFETLLRKSLQWLSK